MTSLTRVIQNAKHLQLLKMMSLQGSLKHTQRSWAIKVRSISDCKEIIKILDDYK